MACLNSILLMDSNTLNFNIMIKGFFIALITQLHGLVLWQFSMFVFGRCPVQYQKDIRYPDFFPVISPIHSR
jgi:hypothetical protein